MDEKPSDLDLHCFHEIEYVRKPCKPQGLGGGTLIFSYIRRLGPFWGVQNFDFQYFGGFSEPEIFLGL